jgi:MFS family permease
LRISRTEDSLTTHLHAALKPVRDRRTYLSYVQMGMFGWFLYTLGPSLALLRDETGMSRTLSTLYSVSASVGGIIAGILVATIVRRFGRGWLLRGGSLSLALGVSLYISGAPLAVTVAGPFFSAVGGAGCVVGVSAFLSAQQRSAGDAAITEANTVAAGFGILGPLMLGAAATWLAGWRVSLALLVVCLIILEITRGRDLSPYRVDDVVPDIDGRHPARLPTLTWWAMVTVVFTSAIEMAYIFWATDLLTARSEWGTAAAAAALSAVLLGVLIGRGAGSWLVERLDAERTLLAALVTLAIGFALTWLWPVPVLILIGLFVVGLGISVQFPLGMARTMRASSGQPDKAAGYASSAVGIAGAAVPFGLAVLADSVGVHLAFLVVPILIMVSILLLRLHPVRAAT